jgi:hypothetical protein
MVMHPLSVAAGAARNGLSGPRSLVRLLPVPVEADRLAPCLGAVAPLVADPEDKHQLPARSEDPMELSEQLGPLLPGNVNDRVACEQSAESGIREIQGRHRGRSVV